MNKAPLHTCTLSEGKLHANNVSWTGFQASRRMPPRAPPLPRSGHDGGARRNHFDTDRWKNMPNQQKGQAGHNRGRHAACHSVSSDQLPEDGAPAGAGHAAGGDVDKKIAFAEVRYKSLQGSAELATACIRGGGSTGSLPVIHTPLRVHRDWEGGCWVSRKAWRRGAPPPRCDTVDTDARHAHTHHLPQSRSTGDSAALPFFRRVPPPPPQNRTQAALESFAKSKVGIPSRRVGAWG